MPQYAEAAEFYDLLYAEEKDYLAEASLIASLVRQVNPAATRVLDVGCGTGNHALHLVAEGFRVDGVDIEPAFVAIASAKCPSGSFTVARHGDARASRSIRRTERHELGLFTQAQMEHAFREAGLEVERRPEVLRTRGLYVGRMGR